jgi:CRISPR-associated protein Cmr3
MNQPLPSHPSPNAEFTQLIIIEPLGLLYGSAGRFLSPENLVGRSGTSFPPSAAALSGLFAAVEGKENMRRDDFFLAGPFWAKNHSLAAMQNFYVPTPFNCLVKPGELTINCQMTWHPGPCEIWCDEVSKPMTWPTGVWAVWSVEQAKQGKGCWQTPPNAKFQKGTWIAISDWEKLNNPATVCDLEQIKLETNPWRFLPHLHPYLKADERHVDTDRERGSLFLENGVQLDPDTCLIYLSNTEIKDGWYRLGGEGHLVQVTCKSLGERLSGLLRQDLGNAFALITSAVWGSNRLSYQSPRSLAKGDAARYKLPEIDSDLQPSDGQTPQPWHLQALLTERPIPFRYRLGNHKDQQGNDIHKPNQPKLLSRGRYAVPAGTVYVTREALPAWSEWPLDWFPQEGPSLKRFGCGLALPLPGALAQGAAVPQTQAVSA